MTLSKTEKQRQRRARLRAKLITSPLPKKGRVERDGERIQCHVCGIWLKCLAPSHIALHNMNADDYREEFGLNRRQPLCSEERVRWHSEHIAKNCRLNRNTDIEKVWKGREKLKGMEHRLQARIINSEVRKGKPVKMTPSRAVSQKENALKALIPMTCENCGTRVMRNKSVRHAFCNECRPVHKAQYMRNYNDANAQRLREYWREYDQRRRRKAVLV